MFRSITCFFRDVHHVSWIFAGLMECARFGRKEKHVSEFGILKTLQFSNNLLHGCHKKLQLIIHILRDMLKTLTRSRKKLHFFVCCYSLAAIFQRSREQQRWNRSTDFSEVSNLKSKAASLEIRSLRCPGVWGFWLRELIGNFAGNYKCKFNHWIYGLISLLNQLDGYYLQ